jgi:glutaminyl-tRNA synthetase
MAVLDPLKVVITNYPEDTTEYFEIENNPEDESMGKREIPFTRELYIEREDFMEHPVKGYHRLYVGNEVRLKSAYYVTCNEIVKDSEGNIVELKCTYDPDSKYGTTEDKRRVRGTSHWVSATHGLKATVRLYDKLFLEENPGARTGNYLDDINPDSLLTLDSCIVEPSLKDATPGEYLQFIRNGYFVPDSVEFNHHSLVFNRTVTLKDSWSKQKKK